MEYTRTEELKLLASNRCINTVDQKYTHVVSVIDTRTVIENYVGTPPISKNISLYWPDMEFFLLTKKDFNNLNMMLQLLYSDRQRHSRLSVYRLIRSNADFD